MTAVLVTGLQRTGTNAIKSALRNAYPGMENHGEVFQPPAFGTERSFFEWFRATNGPVSLVDFVNLANAPYVNELFWKYIDSIKSEDAIIDIKYNNFNSVSSVFTFPMNSPAFLNVWKSFGLPIVRTFRRNKAALALSAMIADELKVYHAFSKKASVAYNETLSNANIELRPAEIYGRIKSMVETEQVFDPFFVDYDRVVTINYDLDLMEDSLCDRVSQELQDLMGKPGREFRLQTRKPSVSKAESIANLDEIGDYFRGNEYEGMVKSALYYE